MAFLYQRAGWPCATSLCPYGPQDKKNKKFLFFSPYSIDDIII
jgi:hypothetical protein